MFVFSWTYIHCLPPKKFTFMFSWTAFSFEYGTHLLWHHFNKLLQCHNIYFLYYFFSMMLCWWWGSWTGVHSLLQHILKIINGVKVWTLWWPIHVWKCLMLPEPVFHGLSPMTPGIDILECACAIREGKKSIDGITWSFFGHIKLLNLDLTNCSKS